MVILPDSARLRAALADLPAAKKRSIRARKHPWIARPMVVVRASESGGEEIARGFVEKFGECVWTAGRWRTIKTQLRIPGF